MESHEVGPERASKHTFENHPVPTRPYGPRLLTDRTSDPHT